MKNLALVVMTTMGKMFAELTPSEIAQLPDNDLLNFLAWKKAEKKAQSEAMKVQKEKEAEAMKLLADRTEQIKRMEKINAEREKKLQGLAKIQRLLAANEKGNLIINLRGVESKQDGKHDWLQISPEDNEASFLYDAVIEYLSNYVNSVEAETFGQIEDKEIEADIANLKA